MKSRNNARRRLIVNADDFGLSPGVNAGIVDAHRRGILTSATLLANAPCFDEAVRLAKETPSLGVGLHLNIVRGMPLTPPGEIPLLVDAHGCFRRFRIRRMNRGFLRQAGLEYRAQLRKIFEAGLRPTHIDFEKHHAWQGRLYRLACELAAECGVRAVRNLSEPVAWTVRALGWPGLSAVAMAAFLRSGFQLSAAGCAGLARPDCFLGQCHIGAMTEEVWLKLLPSLPSGVIEVMTHPGLPGDVSSADGMGYSWLEKRREAEHAALCFASVRKALDGSGAELIHFGDLTNEAVAEG